MSLRVPLALAIPMLAEMLMDCRPTIIGTASALKQSGRELFEFEIAVAFADEDCELVAAEPDCKIAHPCVFL